MRRKNERFTDDAEGVVNDIKRQIKFAKLGEGDRIFLRIKIFHSKILKLCLI